MPSLQKLTIIALFLVLGVLFTPGSQVRGEDHVVSPSELDQTLLHSAKNRQANLEKIQQFFSSELSRKALTPANGELNKVQEALPQLSDEELARLVAQTQKVEADIAAGALTNQEITYILIALATAVIILVLVAA